MRVRNMVLWALFTALMCVSAWISIPLGEIVFSLQTLCLLLVLNLLGGRAGSAVCLVYLLLGCAGLPVFSGFRGGLGVLLGTTGGYIIGFLLGALLYWLVTAVLGNGLRVRLFASALALAGGYALGTAWFYLIYLPTGTAMSLAGVLMKCVVPFLLPDALKLVAAMLLAARLKSLLT